MGLTARGVEMKLRENVDYEAFLLAVDECAGGVWFYTDQGDKLNLKSVLLRFVFSAATGNAEVMASSQIVLDHEADMEKLGRFLKTQGED